MLMTLGPVAFDLRVGLDEVQKMGKSAFAKHDIVNGSPVYEAMGEDEGSFTIGGVVHPEHFGGLSRLSAIEAARVAQIPLPFIRGDFTPLGWVGIQEFSESSKSINFYGIGREIEFTVKLIRTGSPAPSMAASILRLF
ncbi:phage tail protein [Hoeflea sp.]|uniref:phage tail protein n=1 Tax=Hoeflea sp. TaxID=1940281 RepID=UPI003B51DC5E